ncbi:MAG TPA: type II toxin-antitoxin system VapC family toxin [bacterium]|nr:type II toxin-antitoxin system VapC family toxin [bacterium]
MRILLDTHAFLWFVAADPRLSRRAEEALRHGDNELLLSMASVWEIAIKVGIGRLPLSEPLETFIPEQLQLNRIGLLPIQLSHTLSVARLPLHHRDPFDRLIIAQALLEDLPLVSGDGELDSYPIQRLW